MNSTLTIDFPPMKRERYTGEFPESPLLKFLAKDKQQFVQTMRSYSKYKPMILDASLDWTNGYVSAMDAVALYSIVTKTKPNYFFEIGSGNSTRIARAAIRDSRLQTKLVSLDPEPRQEIDIMCSQVIRHRLEFVNPSVFEDLNAGDIVFFDGSHRVLQNSDVTVFFLEVLPRLKPGVLVHIHDIFWPNDYPSVWFDRHYSEQYLLGMYLLTRKPQVLMPVAYTCDIDEAWINKEWESVIPESFEITRRNTGGYPGTSFWFRV